MRIKYSAVELRHTPLSLQVNQTFVYIIIDINTDTKSTVDQTVLKIN